MLAKFLKIFSSLMVQHIRYTWQLLIFCEEKNRSMVHAPLCTSVDYSRKTKYTIIARGVLLQESLA